MAQMPPPPPGMAPYTAPASTQTNTMAVISLASGIGSWFVLPIIGGVIAVVTGHIARKQIRETGEQGGGLATIGLVLGYIHLAVVALVILILILVFVVVGAAVFQGVQHPPVVSPTG